jgi:glycosyltransferase involved in cell wall biosynthesis
MHVGIWAPTLSERYGGGYTMENDLFEAIIGEGLSTQHRFTVLSNSSVKTNLLAYPTLVLPKTGLIKGTIRKLVKRIIRKSHRMLGAAAKSMGVLNANHSAPRLDDTLARNGIEFIISLRPDQNPYEPCAPQPYLIYVWDLEHRKQPFFPEVRGDQWERRQKLFYQVLGQAAFVVTGTRVGAQEVQRFFGVDPTRIRIIPHSTPQFALESLGPDELEEPLSQLPVGAPFLFYPAQFWAHKNHITALKAIKQLQERHQLNIKLVLVGSDHGNWRHVQEWICRLQLKADVIWPGFVSKAQLRWLYRNALALIYPSLFGPENLPPLEAFALGCPVIASAIDGASEQLGDAAVLCDPLDPASFANAAVTILKDASLRADLIERGKTRAAQWTRKDAAKALVGILDEFAVVRDNWGDVAKRL